MADTICRSATARRDGFPLSRRQNFPVSSTIIQFVMPASMRYHSPMEARIEHGTGQIMRARWILLTAVIFLGMARTSLAVPTVCPQEVTVGCENSCTLRIPVLVGGPVTLDALGFDVVFDDTKLSFDGLLPGVRFADWQVLSAQLIAPGRVRVGGFNATAVSVTGSEVLATLNFATLQIAGCVRLTLDTFVDDLAPAAPCAEFSTWTTSTTGYPDNGTIGVFADSLGENCCFQVGQDQTLWVVAQLAGGSSAGVVGAEFRIQIEPPDPGATLVWTPSNLVDSSVGDPVDNSGLAEDDSGVWLSLASCASQSRIVLGTLRVMNLTGPHDITVRHHNRPTEPRFPCVKFASCGGTDCDVVCLAETGAVDDDPVLFRSRVNANCDGLTCGFVTVNASSWGNLKSLYR